MIKRLAIALILFSIVVHSASRLGVLSYLYQQRHEIAYTLGIIAEVPIALCSSDYNIDSGLKIHVADERDEAPPHLLAREILLFLEVQTPNINSLRSLLTLSTCSPYMSSVYKSPSLAIFQPPKV